MNTLVFDELGRCICAANVEIGAENFPGASFFVNVPLPVEANTVYYDIGAKQVRQRTQMAYQITTNTISGLPAGTKAIVKGELLTVDDGSLELDVLHPENVRVLLMHVKFYDTEVEVPCEAQG